MKTVGLKLKKISTGSWRTLVFMPLSSHLLTHTCALSITLSALDAKFYQIRPLLHKSILGLNTCIFHKGQNKKQTLLSDQLNRHSIRYS